MKSHENTVWDRLQAERPLGERLTARIGFPDITDKLYAAIDSKRKRHFLIPLQPEEEGLNDYRSRGVRVRCEDLRSSGKGIDNESRRYIDITCLDSSGHEVFDIIGREIAASLSSGSVSKSESVRRNLSKWRYFWGRPIRNIMAREEVIGMLSELWYLSHWLLPFSAPLDAISAWSGPMGARHDFEWTSVSVEVKGTTSVSGRRHWIHGLDQLLPPKDGKLFLFSLKIREERGADISLPELIRSCRDSISRDEEALDLFEKRLAFTNYSPDYDDEYETMKFSLVDQALYEVRDPFPRLIPQMLSGAIPSGVEVVEYEINLEAYESLIISRSPVAMQSQ